MANRNDVILSSEDFDKRVEEIVAEQMVLGGRSNMGE
jgi:hypothetical protein